MYVIDSINNFFRNWLVYILTFNTIGFFICVFIMHYTKFKENNEKSLRVRIKKLLKKYPMKYPS